jgi:hypothetical protein
MAWFGSAPPTPKTPDKFQGLAPVPLLPPATTLAASAATSAADLAATKVKKKAIGAGDTVLTAPAAGVKPAVLAPRSLLGS